MVPDYDRFFLDCLEESHCLVLEYFISFQFYNSSLFAETTHHNYNPMQLCHQKEESNTIFSYFCFH